MSHFSHSFNIGFTFGMLSSFPAFGCMRNFFAPVFRMPFMPFCTPRFSLPFIPFQTYHPYSSSEFSSTFVPTPIEPVMPDTTSIFNSANYSFNPTSISPDWTNFDSFSFSQTNYDNYSFTNTQPTYAYQNNWNNIPTYTQSQYTYTPTYTQTYTTYSYQPTVKTTTATVATNKTGTTSRTAASTRTSGAPKHWSQMTDTQMREIYGNYDRDVTVLYKGTAAKLDKYLNTNAASILKNKGSVFMEAQKKYGISALVLIAICGKESTFGKYGTNNKYYNVANIRGKDGKFKRYNSVDECIMDLARMLKQSYVDNPPEKPGAHLKTLYQINARYCPVGVDGNTPIWAKGVEEFATQIERVAA